MSTQGFAEELRDARSVEKELEALEAEIEKFRRMLESTQGKRSNLEEELKTNEQGISDIIRRIEAIQQNLSEGEDRLSSLSEEQRQLLSQKAEQQVLIARQIRAAYELGHEEYLKVVLNQEDPNRIARMLTYYDYFNRARLSRIRDYEQLLKQLDEVTAAIAAQNLELNDQRQGLQVQKTGLDSAQRQRKRVLSALNREIAETGSQLDKSLADRERLEALLERITAGILNLATPEDTRPFRDMRGNLLMPVSGKISHRFGSRRTGDKLKWNGVFITADEGTPVHSVHYGRVVFSDWLRGFGLLLIISHGEGFMSLYGHNQVLYRATGDWVTAGEMIANVGNTGGQQDFGLYFEIRTAGKPSDPQRWCKVRPAEVRPAEVRPAEVRPAGTEALTEPA